MTGWDALLDQRRVVETLQRAVARQRVAHAYLFYGPDGVGKRATALAFGQALQCERADGTTCGTCPACGKVQRLVHPDVQLLLPYPSDTDLGEVAARLARVAAHPYAAVDFVRRPALDDPTKTSNKQAFYSIKRINEELRRTMSFKPLEGRYKIVVMTDADQMRAEAANAFLKLLEEPGPRTVFVLTTSRPDRLLPTILSRCQRLRFDPLPAEAVEAALIARDGTAAGPAAALARMADGSYTRALELAENDDLMADRALVVDLLRLAYARRTPPLAELIERLARLGRERLKAILRLTTTWLRDLVLFDTLGAEAPLVNVDQSEAVARFCRNVPDADLGAMVALVEEAVELVERNVHLSLVLTALAHALGRAMRGPHPGRLYLPLAEPDPLG